MTVKAVNITPNPDAVFGQCAVNVHDSAKHLAKRLPVKDAGHVQSMCVMLHIMAETCFRTIDDNGTITTIIHAESVVAFRQFLHTLTPEIASIVNARSQAEDEGVSDETT